MADLNQAIKLNPRDSSGYNSRSKRVETFLGYFDAAQADRKKAADLVYTSMGDTYRNRAKLEVDRGEREAALTNFNQAIQVNPEDVGAYIGRGRLKLASRALADALDDCNRAIKLDPTNALAYFWPRGRRKPATNEYENRPWLTIPRPLN